MTATMMPAAERAPYHRRRLRLVSQSMEQGERVMRSEKGGGPAAVETHLSYASVNRRHLWDYLLPPLIAGSPSTANGMGWGSAWQL